MVDLNHIFLFLALASPLAVLAGTWRSRADPWTWRLAAGVVLAVTGIAWLMARQKAGYIGAGAWFVLLFVPAIGLKRMSELSARHQYTAAKKLAAMLQWLHPSADLRGQIQTLRYLEQRQAAGNLPPSITPSGGPWPSRYRLRNSPAVLALIVANILVFIVELVATARAPNGADVLLRLGALQPALVLLRHEYWRLVASLFLHAGALHLLFNLFALYILGPPFERAVGALRFVTCYMIAGICATVGIVILWRLRITEPTEVVGASGCVMGVVGAWAAFLLRDHRTAMARRRLINILMIVVIQTAFDLTTPKVSMSSHLFGLAGGFLVGLIVAPRTGTQRVDRRVSWSA